MKKSNPPTAMTEPIDQATKDLIEKEARVFASRWAPIDLRRADAFDNYIAGATAWAEKLKQLETQSHDQVRIIEHLEGQLKQERTLIKDLVGYVIAYKGLASLTSDEDIFIQSLLKKAKDKSHE